jgi:hypothetical protein
MGERDPAPLMDMNKWNYTISPIIILQVARLFRDGP